jgi:hypothetical protein
MQRENSVWLHATRSRKGTAEMEYAPVAQLVEHRPCNAVAERSNRLLGHHKPSLFRWTSGEVISLSS